LGKMLQKVMREHPDADRDTVWRFLRDLEDTPEEWLWRALRLGRYAVSKKLR
ncbi:hypothetical protein HY256_01735, partial [Candidatus Sumerlaeota bacterium]|nr:hypothetical protein [Candidatus Sumerlaeota bacterium]